MVIGRKKFDIEEERSGYQTTSTLTIRNFQVRPIQPKWPTNFSTNFWLTNLQVTDESSYTCVSTNPIGNSEATIRLYGNSTLRQISTNFWPILTNFFANFLCPISSQFLNFCPFQMQNLSWQFWPIFDWFWPNFSRFWQEISYQISFQFLLSWGQFHHQFLPNIQPFLSKLCSDISTNLPPIRLDFRQYFHHFSWPIWFDFGYFFTAFSNNFAK